MGKEKEEKKNEYHHLLFKKWKIKNKKIKIENIKLLNDIGYWKKNLCLRLRATLREKKEEKKERGEGKEGEKK